MTLCPPVKFNLAIFSQIHHIDKFSHYHIAGNFCGVQKFAFFEGKTVNAKIKTGMNSHAPVFYMQSYWWVWFPGIEPQILEPTNISAEGSVVK